MIGGTAPKWCNSRRHATALEQSPSNERAAAEDPSAGSFGNTLVDNPCHIAADVVGVSHSPAHSYPAHRYPL